MIYDPKKKQIYLDVIYEELTLNEFLQEVQNICLNKNLSNDEITIVPCRDDDGSYIEIYEYRDKTQKEIEEEKLVNEKYRLMTEELEKTNLKKLINKYKEKLPEILGDKESI
jgi:hypothetical protein